MRLHVRVCVVVFVCLTATACVRSLDGSRVQCSTSDHCPSDRMCSAGKCVSRSSDARPGNDMNTADLDGPGQQDGTPSESPVDASTAVAPPDSATATADLASDPPARDTMDAPLGVGGTSETASTGGAGGAGAPGSGGTHETGGMTASNGNGGSGGSAPGTGGIVGSGGIASSGGALSSGGNVTTGGLVGTGGAAPGGTTGTGGTTTPQTNYCAEQTCNGHGTCISGTTGYTCTCSDAWSGVNCQVDPCSGMTCNGHGTCSAGTCTCTGSWSGPTCATPVPPTLSGPQDVTMCNGAPNATFTVAVAGGTGAYSYRWHYVDESGVDYTSFNESSGEDTSTLSMYLQGRGSPYSPGKYKYYVVVTDGGTHVSVQSRVATLWLASPSGYAIQYHRIDGSTPPVLSVQIEAPLSGCISIYFVNDGSTNYNSVGQVCAGAASPQWRVVGTVDLSNSANNVVMTRTMEGASGLNCYTDMTWIWPGP